MIKTFGKKFITYEEYVDIVQRMIVAPCFCEIVFTASHYYH